MEFKTYIQSDLHPKPITCFTYHTHRRELWTGSEDGLIRGFDTETGRLTFSILAHRRGWITALIYCKEFKCVLSSSHDGLVLVWGSGGKLIQTIQTGSPVYALSWNARRLQLMCGHKQKVQVYQAKDDFLLSSSYNNTSTSTSFHPPHPHHPLNPSTAVASSFTIATTTSTTTHPPHRPQSLSNPAPIPPPSISTSYHPIHSESSSTAPPPITSSSSSSSSSSSFSPMTSTTTTTTTTSSSSSSFSDTFLNLTSITLPSHEDLVTCLVACETRFYSASLDRRLVIYESYPHGFQVRVLSTIFNAHEAGITCMTYAKDSETGWLITGGFDKQLKLWSLEGHCLHQVHGFQDTLTGLTYVIPLQLLWTSSLSMFPQFVDPHNGVVLSDFVKADNEVVLKLKKLGKFQLLTYVSETQEVIASTQRRQLVIWKFNFYAPLTTLTTNAVEALTVSFKDPLFLYSGGAQGELIQWERMQLNTYMYSSERLSCPSTFSSTLSSLMKKDPHPSPLKKSKVHQYASSFQRKSSSSSSSSFATSTLGSLTKAIGVPTSPAITTLVYHDPLDLLVVGYEDGWIRWWGYPSESTPPTLALPPITSTYILDPRMQPRIQPSFSSSSSLTTPLLTTTRMSGLSFQAQYQAHQEAITCIVCYDQYIVSSGYDKRVLVYDIYTHHLMDGVMVTPSSSSSSLSGSSTKLNFFHSLSSTTELAADGPILAMTFMQVKSPSSLPLNLNLNSNSNHTYLCPPLDKMEKPSSPIIQTTPSLLLNHSNTSPSPSPSSSPLPKSHPSVGGLVKSSPSFSTEAPFIPLPSSTTTSSSSSSTTTTTLYLVYASADHQVYIRECPSYFTTPSTLPSTTTHTTPISTFKSFKSSSSSSSSSTPTTTTFSHPHSNPNGGGGGGFMLRRVLQGHEAEVTQVQYLGPKQWLVTGSEDKTIRIWDAVTYQLLFMLNNESEVTSLCVDCINLYILSGGRDGIVRVFEEQKLLRHHVGHFDEIQHIVHVPQRKQYITSSLDNTIRIWYAFPNLKLKPPGS